MSISVWKEIEFLIHSIIFGICITFAYDWLRIIRNIWKHNVIAISMEDAIYWIFCSIFVFMTLHRENNGILRWFVIIGAIIGMFLYKLTVSQIFIKILTKIGKRLRWATQKIKKPTSIIIKKLTAGIKLFKMMIYKQ